jgi:RimJ/RimL family protein N-acetyltransferase
MPNSARCTTNPKPAIEQVGADVLRLTSPFPEYALPRVWTWIEDFRRRVADDYSPKTLGEFMRHWKEREPFRKTWGVWRGEDLGGLVIYEPWQPGVGTSHALFKRSFWGRTTTRNALDLVYSELFASGVRKVVNFPFRGNNAIIALGKSLGAVTEGVLKGQTLRDGKPTDVIILSLFKEDFEKCRSLPQPCRTSPPESAPLPAA